MSRLNSLVELIDKLDRSARLAPAAGDPLVPAGHHDKGRIEGERSRPLLLKVGTALDCARRFVVGTIVKTTASASTALILVTRPSLARKFCADQYVDLFRPIGIGGVAVSLGIGRLPVPGVLGVDLRERPVGAAKGEERPQVGAGIRRITKHQAACPASKTTGRGKGRAYRGR